MSWMAKLYETYEHGLKLDISEKQQLMPISHTLQNAHINIVVDINGNFKRASVLEKTQIVLPATEKSAGRSSGEAAHPLADKLQYVAGDYAMYGGLKKAHFEGYKRQLLMWCKSKYCHPKAKAVYYYIEKGQVIADLITSKVCFVDEQNRLLTSWPHEVTTDNPQPLLFKVLPKEKKKLDQGNALVCWTVECEGEPVADTWKDKSLQQSWIDFEAASEGEATLCYICGENKSPANNHPAKLRHTGDKAKLISANDSSGFTYRGRFIGSDDAASVSLEVTQKAHNALRWLISRQAFRNGDQAVVAWAVSGKPIPNPLTGTDTFDLNLDNLEEVSIIDIGENEIKAIDHSRNLGQDFGLKLKRYMQGYHAKLEPTESIVIMAVDSATPGRMGITYYRDYMANDYLTNLENWHQQFAWYQRASNVQKEKYGKVWFISAPAPWAILNAAYGDIIKSNETLKKNLYERLIPCIVENRAFPYDLVNLTIHRAGNRNNSEHWEWERNLGVACALFRGFFNRHPKHNLRRDYPMALDTKYRSRDYLYGRLLAIAEYIEEMAMFIAGEPARSTQASRLMQRFSDHPASTWLLIEKGIVPYQERLKSKIAPLEAAYKRLLDDVCDVFDIGDFNSKERLSGEYLLGFHCQRKWLRDHKLEKGKWVLKTNSELSIEIKQGLNKEVNDGFIIKKN
jgi:CRISPR-associated protein Csd1